MGGELVELLVGTTVLMWAPDLGDSSVACLECNLAVN